MANPPFNVDGVDSVKVKADPRLPFGLPGINKKKQVSNANYLWISSFYSYLNEKDGLVESYFTEMLTYADSVDDRIAGYISAIKESDGVSVGSEQTKLFEEFIKEAGRCKKLISNFQKSHSVKTNKKQLTAFSDFEPVTVELKALKISLEHSFKAVLEGFNQSRNSKKQRLELGV